MLLVVLLGRHISQRVGVVVDPPTISFFQLFILFMRSDSPSSQCYSAHARCGSAFGTLLVLCVLPGVQSNQQARAILVDIGANCGDSFMRFVQMHSGLQAANAELYLWEANPILVSSFLDKLPARDPRVHILPYAASTEDAFMAFRVHKGRKYSNQSSGRCTLLPPACPSLHGPTPPALPPSLTNSPGHERQWRCRTAAA